MINVSEMMSDPDFATRYQVARKTGKWVSGRFEFSDEKILNFYGPVQPATPDDMEQLPEGDRDKTIMKFFCKTPKTFFKTTGEGSDDDDKAILFSDTVIYKNQRYKVIQVSNWSSYGYVKAFAYRIGAYNAEKK